MASRSKTRRAWCKLQDCEDQRSVIGLLRNIFEDFILCFNGVFFFAELKYNQLSCESNDQNIIFEFNSKGKENVNLNVNIQRKYFTIEREAAATIFNLSPAILTCTGRRLEVNEKIKLRTNECRILQQGDVIKIKGTQKSFKFFDLRNQDHQSLHSAEVKNQFYIGEVLGSGYTGSVYLAHDIVTLKKFAIKTYKKQNSQPNSSFLQEVAIMEKLKHHNLVKLIKVIQSPLHDHLLTEYMNAGDMLHLILSSPLKRLSEGESKFAMHQILQGLNYLHDRNFVHLDIKLENVFINFRNGEHCYKIGDFGFSAAVEMVSSKKGSRYYCSPEIFTSQPDELFSGKKSDMWSLGVLLFTSLSGCLPFHENYGSLKVQITTVDLHFRGVVWTTISSEAKKLIKRLILLNPNDRLSSNQVTSQSWFNDEALKSRIVKLHKILRRDTSSTLSNPSKRQKLR